MGRSPTIIDVAAAAGVSKSLVSRAIRSQRGVAPETRERILAAAEQLGYRSNQWARSLKRGQTDLVGVLVTDLDNGYHVDVAHGVEDTAAGLGMGVLIADGRRDPSMLRTQIDRLMHLGVDGLIVVSALLPGDELADIARHTPLVVIGRPPSMDPSLSSVHNYDELGARSVVEFLVAQRHRRIWFVRRSDRPAARARETAYFHTMSTMSMDAHTCSMGVDEVDTLVEAVLRDLREVAQAGPTAVFASNDRAAVAVLSAALDAGIRIPEDLSVVGYDNTAVAALLRPQLTTVDQPRAAMGEWAMRTLAAQIGGTTAPRRAILQPTLVVRESTATARI